MDILEYQARDLFDDYDIPVMKALVVSSRENLKTKIGYAQLSYPIVAKVQIPMGKRGKAGGIRFAENYQELEKNVNDLLGNEILGFKVHEIMLVEKATYDEEFYISIILDRLSKKPMIIFSAEGGMDIEELAQKHPEKILKISIDPFVGICEFHAMLIISFANLKHELKPNLYAILKKLYRCFVESDCLLVEVNPLVRTENDLIALDGKVKIDDSALFRLPKMREIREKLFEDELVKKARQKNFLYIPVEKDGRIAVMSNGSGLIMSCIDLISAEGQKVAAALDLGGGATSDRIEEALKILFSTEGVDSVLINIFGGITRCDEVAQGIIHAWNTIGDMKNVVILMQGTNRDLGLSILSEIKEQVILPRNLKEGVKSLVQRMENL